MKILFVMEQRENAGSIHAVANYIRAADEHGHTVAVYGPPRAEFPGVRFCTDPRAFDRVVFLFESQADFVRPLSAAAVLASIPRQHRFIFDADGMYNPTVRVDDYDRNHVNETERVYWRGLYSALADRVLQPTLRTPTDRQVIPLLFYGYDPALRLPPGEVPAKRFDILHVGHNWWRWKELATELLPAFEQIRDEVGEIAFAGLWWDGVPWWCRGTPREDAFRLDSAKFRELRIRLEPAVPFNEVIRTMSTARVNILTQRPVLRHFRHLTLKYFEVFCAETIPLLMLTPDHAEAVYGPAGRELSMTGRVAEKLLDALRHPDRYREVVEGVRRHLLAHHSYDRRLRELLAVLQDAPGGPGR
jgi:hypothetical protein